MVLCQLTRTQKQPIIGYFKRICSTPVALMGVNTAVMMDSSLREWFKIKKQMDNYLFVAALHDKAWFCKA